MATYRLTGPDGSTYNVTAPDGVSQDDVLKTFHANLPAQAPAAAPPIPHGSPLGRGAAAGPLGIGVALASPGGRQEAANLLAGAVRGAGSIGATLMAPIDMGSDAVNAAMGGPARSVSSNQQRRADMTQTLADLGADPGSTAFGVGKLGGEVAGTAGAGGVLANGLARVPGVASAAPGLINALRSGGMTTGAPAATTLGGHAVDLGVRMAGGGVAGAASGGLVDPNIAATSGAVGLVLPPLLKGAGALGGVAADAAQAGARRLMQSALKPTIAQLRNGDAATAVQTLLDYGINPTEKGVSKLKDLISGLNDQVTNAIGSSTATVSKQNVVNALAGTRQKFGSQVSPTSDLNAIGGVEGDFLNHPLVPGQDIPVQLAQQMKQGTYKVLAGKYGQMGSAETEAQKALARGLKDEIASAVPAVGPLNAEESRLLSTLSVAERRALMDANKNPMGLAALAHNPLSWAAFMADKSAGFKALAARMLNTASGAAVSPGAQNLLRSTSGPLLRSSLVSTSAQNANP